MQMQAVSAVHASKYDAACSNPQMLHCMLDSSRMKLLIFRLVDPPLEPMTPVYIDAV
jgi:hypothetical protein